MKRRVFLSKAACLLVAAYLITACSSPNDNSSSAKQVAEQWVLKNIDLLAGKMATALLKDYSALAKPLITMALKSGMSYKYYPQKISTDNWKVVVELSSIVDLSKLKIAKVASAKGQIDLIIDTKNLIVLTASYDPANVVVDINDK